MSGDRETTSARSYDTDTQDALPREAALRATAAFPVQRRTSRSVMSEGRFAGGIAATGVVLAFLIGDTMHGDPLLTPVALGMGLEHALGLPSMGDLVAALGYTALHYAAFIVIATAFAAIARRAQRDSTVLAGTLLIAFVAELAFCGLLVILRQTTYTGAITWPQLVLGNVLGWTLLGWAMWHMHPELGAEIDTAMHGTGAWPSR